MRILPYMDDYLALFRSRSAALAGARQFQTMPERKYIDAMVVSTDAARRFFGWLSHGA